jgi:hypothetical protein
VFIVESEMMNMGVVWKLKLYSIFVRVVSGMPSKEAFESVQGGYRMPRPDLCPSEVYDVILSCWQTAPHSRPSFDFLNTFLHDYET